MEAYRTGKHIGEGAHGVVLLAHHIESGKPVALKKVCYHGYRHTTSTHTTDTASNAGHANLNHHRLSCHASVYAPCSSSSSHSFHGPCGGPGHVSWSCSSHVSWVVCSSHVSWLCAAATTTLSADAPAFHFICTPSHTFLRALPAPVPVGQHSTTGGWLA